MTTILGGCRTVPQMFYFPNFVFPIYNLRLTSGYHHVFSVHPLNSYFICYHLGSLISKHLALDHYAINMYSLRNQYIFIMLSICIHGSFNICSLLCFFLSSLSAKTRKLGFSIHLQSVSGTVPQLPQSLNQQPSLRYSMTSFLPV